MGTNIPVADYQGIARAATQIQILGLSMNTQISNAYNTVDNLRSQWQGNRYDELIKLFNETSTDINQMLEVAIVNIPTAMSTAAQNYARVEGESVAMADNGTVNKIQTLATTNAIEIKYFGDSAETARNTVTSCFTEVKDIMQQINQALNSASWEGTAAEAFKARIQTLSGRISSNFDTINAQFIALMTQAAADYAAAESSNTVD